MQLVPVQHGAQVVVWARAVKVLLELQIEGIGNLRVVRVARMRGAVFLLVKLEDVTREGGIEVGGDSACKATGRREW